MKSLAAALVAALSVAASAQTAPPDPDVAPTAEQRLAALESRLDKLENAPANASISSFNPAIGMAIDAVVRDSNNRANFDFRAAELNLEAPVDPFLKAWAVITGSNQGVDVEEAAMQTTALPYNLTVRGGRVFAPFGRLSAWHDHELPMVDRPNSLNTFVGGEAHADGLEVNCLFPTPFYLEGTVGAYNRIGADNNRTDILGGNSLSEWTYLGRLHTYNEVTDSLGFDLGVSEAWTPKSGQDRPTSGPLTGSVVSDPRNDSGRTLSGVDLTLRYQPAVGGLYKGFIWGTEVLQNDERTYDAASGAADGRAVSYAGYSNIESKLGRVVRVGGYADLTELTYDNRSISRSYAGYLTFEITEFDRIRLQYTRVMNNFSGDLSSLPGTDFGYNDLTGLHPGSIVSLQWTAVIGYHVHGFRGRWGS